jgi:hypothetical protein
MLYDDDECYSYRCVADALSTMMSVTMYDDDDDNYTDDAHDDDEDE